MGLKERREGHGSKNFAKDRSGTAYHLGRFAVRAAEYLKEFYKERYQTLVRFGKLAEKMQEVEAEAYQMMEELENSYLKENLPKNPQSTMEQWQLREQKKIQVEEIVMREVVLKFH